MHSLAKIPSVSVPCSVRHRLSNLNYVVGYSTYVQTGSFVTLYRVLLNAFPLLFPANTSSTEQSESLSPSALLQVNDSATCDSEPDPPRYDLLVDSEERTARLSSAAKAHQTWLRKRSTRWHSIVAGAVAGGVAISFESFSRRKVIAQQLFVRRVLNVPLRIESQCRMFIMQRTSRFI
jgi:hypothetical protein